MPEDKRTLKLETITESLNSGAMLKAKLILNWKKEEYDK